MRRESPTTLTTRPPQPCGPAALARISPQELEDDTDSITQLFLNADGTITCARG